MDPTIWVAIIGGAFTLINMILSTVSSFISKKQTKRAADQEAEHTALKQRMNQYLERIDDVEVGLQSLLRLEIIRSHEKYMDRKFCPLYAKESLTRAYKSYHKLGGNDIATDLYNELMDLPLEPKE